MSKRRTLGCVCTRNEVNNDLRLRVTNAFRPPTVDYHNTTHVNSKLAFNQFDMGQYARVDQISIYTVDVGRLLVGRH